MPEYEFVNKKTGEKKTIILGVNEPKDQGKDWDRVWSPPQVATNTKWDPLSSRDWVNKTREKRGTVGDLMDKSKELSIKREEIAGKDQVKESYLNDYSVKRKGKVHPEQAQGKLKEDCKKLGVDIDI